MKISLPIHSYEHRSPQVSSRRLVNCYAEQAPLQAKAPVALLRSPGVRSWVTLPTSPVRGMCVHSNSLYVVAGARLYRVTQGGAYTEIGSLPGTARVSMASNGLQLVIVTNPNGYVYDGTLTQITDEDYTARGASQVTVSDGFAIFVTPGSEDFFHSDYLDAKTFDGLNFSPTGGSPDKLNAIIADHRQLFLFGTESIELFYNAGSAGSPFTREANGFIEVGCGAAGSPAKADNTVLWIDSARIARKLSDLTPLRVSTHALEQKWAGYSRIDDAYSFTVIHEGHTFWCVTFPSGGDTFLYDLATGEWSERRSRLLSGGDAHWRASGCVHSYGMNVVGDTRSGALGILAADCYTEFGMTLRMEATFPNIYAEGRRAFHHRLQVDVQAGAGLVTGQGYDPQMMLYVSDDGGMTFDAVQSKGTGELGQYTKRTTWNRLGSSTDRVYRVAISDPVPVALWNATLEVDGGRL